MFDITNGKGFKMTFANGWTVSVQFGGLNYCQYYDYPSADPVLGYHGPSKDAEIAAWDKDGNWYDFGNDRVKGYVSVDDLLTFMNQIAGM